MSTAANIQTLVAKLTAARDAYYNGKPLMSDAAFDALEDELRRLDPTNDLLKQVGAPVTGGWQKARHEIPMSSLNKAQVNADLAGWVQSLGAFPPGKPAFVIMDKLDGISLSLKYENRKLVQGLTRGDGNTGEDITRNVMMMQGAVKVLPPTIAGRPTPQTVYVRAEIVCKKSDFTAYFPGESNPRNTASGTAKRQANPEKCKHLSIIAYQLLPGGQPLPYKSDEITNLKDMGFQVPEWNLGSDANDVETIYQSYIERIRANLDYEIDGLVIEVNDAKIRENLGDLNNRPRGAIAYKFPHEQKETILRNIRWQVGNSGRITPVAEFDPVHLAGVEVEKASLHNISNIRALSGDKGTAHFAVGDKILVSRRNDVIPFVEELLVPDPSGKILTVPTECPSCNATLERDGEYLVCRNVDCEAQASGAIKRWVQKVGILHLGDSVIEAMVEHGLIEDAADLYTVDPDTVAALYIGDRRVGGMADRGFANLKAKMTLPLHVIVGSIGIPMIGRTMAKTIVDGGFNSLAKMLKAKIPEVAAIPGVGEAKARAFVEGFQQRAGLIAKLLGNGITVQSANGHLLGKSFCLTGFRDPALQDAIEKVGGTIKSGVSKGLDYLIAQDPNSNSGKAQKARAYGTTIISIEDAWELVKG